MGEDVETITVEASRLPPLWFYFALGAGLAYLGALALKRA
jgi:hypothetical protein